MKKLRTFVILWVLVCACALPAFGTDGQYATAGELYQAWAEELPDYICGVWSTDGGTSRLTFGIQENAAGSAGKQEILALIRDDSTVSFVYQKHSRNHLIRIQDALGEYLQQDLGLISAGLNEIENQIDLAIYEKRRDDPATKALVAELTDQYGDAIAIEYTDQLIFSTLGAAPFYTQPSFWCVLGGAAVCFLFSAGLLLKRRKRLALQPSGGQLSAPSSRMKVGGISRDLGWMPGSRARRARTRGLTEREAAELVRRSELSPPPELDARVMDAIGKAEKYHSER